MRRMIVVLAAMCLCLITACCYAESLDLSSLSQEEMIRLKNDLSARLAPTEADAVLYDKDGIFVAWQGIEDEEESDGSHEYQLDYLISNQTDETMYVDFSTISINGFIISVSNRLALEIPAHTSAYTAATNRWLFDTEILDSIRFNGTFENVAVEMKFYNTDEEGKCSYSSQIATVNTSVVVNGQEPVSPAQRFFFAGLPHTCGDQHALFNRV